MEKGDNIVLLGGALPIIWSSTRYLNERTPKKHSICQCIHNEVRWKTLEVMAPILSTLISHQIIIENDT